MSKQPQLSESDLLSARLQAQALASQQQQAQAVNLQMLLIECARTCYPSAHADLSVNEEELWHESSPENRVIRRQQVAAEALERAIVLIRACGINININKHGG